MTPSLSQLLLDCIESRLNDLHTAMPGIIVKYDPKSQKADVQPCLKYSVDNKEEPLPIIQSVPVHLFGASKAFVHFPIKKDDKVLLLFCEKSIDNWTQDGGVVDVNDLRKHHLTDAIAIAGIYSINELIEFLDDKNIFIVNDKTQIKITDDGKIFFSAKGSEANEAMVLGKTLIEFSNKLIESFNAIIEALQKNIGVGNLGAPVTASPSLIAELIKIKIELEKNKSIYLDNSSTNITSNHFFGER